MNICCKKVDEVCLMVYDSSVTDDFRSFHFTEPLSLNRRMGAVVEIITFQTRSEQRQYVSYHFMGCSCPGYGFEAR
jgi:hypothetical protein